MAVGIGVSNWHIIPPKQENWLSVGYCMHQCSEVRKTGSRYSCSHLNLCYFCHFSCQGNVTIQNEGTSNVVFRDTVHSFLREGSFIFYYSRTHNDLMVVQTSLHSYKNCLALLYTRKLNMLLWVRVFHQGFPPTRKWWKHEAEGC